MPKKLSTDELILLTLEQGTPSLAMDLLIYTGFTKRAARRELSRLLALQDKD